MFRNMSPGAIGIRADLPTTLRLAAETGWQGVDLPAGEALRLAQQTSVEEVAALFARAGLRPGGWGLPLDWRKPYEPAALDALAEQAALAQRLGCTRVYTWLLPFSDERPFRENFQFHVRQLEPIARVLAAHDCRLGLEFIGPRTMREGRRYGFIYTLEGMLCLARAISPNVGLLLDCWHWYTSLGTTADIRALRAEDVVYVHVNDAPEGVAVEAQLDQVRRLPASTGVIDAAGFLGALREIGYDGPVTPEPFEKRLSEQPAEQSAREAHASMLALWRAGGLEGLRPQAPANVGCG
ncbi:MAG TPA: sugar phosphate isomerase/epimerase family protein [Roseiflexaceae bacterium]|nr:sugar phosphate isomerase/epimerase family protein [Roseiflexaceae bacterium]